MRILQSQNHGLHSTEIHPLESLSLPIYEEETCIQAQMSTLVSLEFFCSKYDLKVSDVNPDTSYLKHVQ